LSTKGITSNIICKANGLTSTNYEIGESQGVIITDFPPTIQLALTSIKEERERLVNYINLCPNFANSLKPLGIIENPPIAHLMSIAAEAAGVGPMAAVAGVIADLAIKKMIKGGAKVAVIENGGEVSLHSNKPLTVSVGAGDNYLSNRIGFKVTDFPCGVATSSGRHSHAFSKGDADSVTVFAINAGLADATATAAANKVIGKPGLDVKAGVELALSIIGVQGVLVIRDQKVSIGGKLPQIVSIKES
jgi:ApbE superfamily uncharacterized protein (UPF0280 family)